MKGGILQLYNDYKMNEKNVKEYQIYEQTIRKIYKRFRTYGYKRIKTPTFEQYDLYSKVNSSINQNEMIKVIDRKGSVLVLRPDVTIPITRQLAEQYTELPNELRYFYVQDVFRQPVNPEEAIESTQAGVEYFCKSSPEADAEVIALACHTLRDLGFNEIKIEIGHAGFFKQLIQAINLTPLQLSQIKKSIQSKNVVDIDELLSTLSVDSEIKKAISSIPFLYGDPIEVTEKARGLVQDIKLHETLDYLIKVYEILTMYGLKDFIVLDLGLINHMDYYSDIIFQGYVEKFGKPVLMGGRYDQLGNEFGAEIEAIGFACEVESLVQASVNDELSRRTPIDVSIEYELDCLSQYISIASELREHGYSVLSTNGQVGSQQESIFQVKVSKEEKSLHSIDKYITFTETAELLSLITKLKGSM